MNIVRIWLYKVTQSSLRDPDCKPSPTNTIIDKKVRGDFEYYDISDDNPKPVTRAQADRWSRETGNKVITLRGYPSWMHDMGYRA